MPTTKPTWLRFPNIVRDIHKAVWCENKTVQYTFPDCQRSRKSLYKNETVIERNSGKLDTNKFWKTWPTVCPVDLIHGLELNDDVSCIKYKLVVDVLLVWQNPVARTLKFQSCIKIVQLTKVKFWKYIKFANGCQLFWLCVRSERRQRSMK